MTTRFLALALLLPCFTAAQDSTGLHAATPNLTARRWVVGGATAAAYGGSFAVLSAVWYNNYPRRSFHVFNDGAEWKQVDKVGHAWTAYHASRITTGAWRWAGLSPSKALALGTGTSLLYMFSIEYLDAHSVEWGWSWGDVAANLSGAALFAAQDLAWKEQKVSFKFSSFHRRYGSADLDRRADQLYGTTFQSRLLKDYNAQSYWLSANLRSLVPASQLPAWLNVAVGYGADGMFGGHENRAFDKQTGAVTFDRRDLPRYRQWYLSPDVDFTRIPTRSRFLRTLFFAANLLKFPAPAVELSKGRLRLRGLVF